MGSESTIGESMSLIWGFQASSEAARPITITTRGRGSTGLHARKKQICPRSTQKDGNNFAEFESVMVSGERRLKQCRDVHCVMLQAVAYNRHRGTQQLSQEICRNYNLGGHRER
jgi:hypothetical protein